MDVVETSEPTDVERQQPYMIGFDNNLYMSLDMHLGGGLLDESHKEMMKEVPKSKLLNEGKKEKEKVGDRGYYDKTGVNRPTGLVEAKLVLKIEITQQKDGYATYICNIICYVFSLKLKLWSLCAKVLWKFNNKENINILQKGDTRIQKTSYTRDILQQRTDVIFL
ncbi:hypothetical protein Q3G72_028746 [Acer saccharum]|nr:hypothetical protein Q3G72_028746 [Acer saccharum]